MRIEQYVNTIRFYILTCLLYPQTGTFVPTESSVVVEVVPGKPSPTMIMKAWIIVTNNIIASISTCLVNATIKCT